MKPAAFLLALVLGGCATVPLAAPLPPPQPTPSVVVDLHLHVTMSQAAKPLFKGEPGGTLTRSGSSRLLNQIGEAELHRAGLKLALGALWPPFEMRPGRSALDEAVHQLIALHEFGRRRPGFAIVHTAAQARTALAQNRIAIIPAVEGGEGVLAVEDIDRLWAAGMRALTVVHFGSNAIGGGAHGQMARNLLGIKSEGLEPLGLTPLGRQVIERMIALGILIDVAHASDALVADVLAITEPRGVPVLNTHSGARTLIGMERSISDEIATRLVKGGGLVGVTVFDQMVSQVPESARWPGFQPNSCDEVVAHWLHLAKVVGPEGLVLGSDYNGFIQRHGPGGSCPNGLGNVGDLSALWAALEAHGIPHAALDGMGEKFLALIEVVESKADPAARAQARQVRVLDAALFDVP